MVQWKTKDLTSFRPGFESWLCYFSCPWVNHGTSLSLASHFYKMGIILHVRPPHGGIVLEATMSGFSELELGH